MILRSDRPSASTTTRTARSLDFTAKGGKRQGHATPRSLRVKPNQPVHALQRHTRLPDWSENWPISMTAIVALPIICMTDDDPMMCIFNI